MFDIRLTFCTYFEKIEQFIFPHETYEEYVAFCVRKGSFVCRIDDRKEQTIAEGELIICPPGCRFKRKIVEPATLCMIKFHAEGAEALAGEKIYVSNILRWNEDLSVLSQCLFCDTLPEHPLWLHCCMDIIYIALQSIHEDGTLSSVKKYMDENYEKNLSVDSLAKQVGYTTPHLINKFRGFYGITPKAYLSQIRIQKAKEFLLTTDMLSQEIAYAIGFSDALYFIRFFKKHTGFTPCRFRERGI